MGNLSLAFLGPFRVQLNGTLITAFDSAKVRALLAYLAVESDRSHPRDVLAGLLWSEYPNRDALSNLRGALANLREAIHDRAAKPPYLLITRDTIQFNTASDYSCDATTFIQQTADKSELGNLTETSGLQSAIELYRGMFLDGFSLADCPAFEEWIRLKREQFSRLALFALRRLADNCERHREYELAQTYARKQLGIEPWDEQAHQQLMRALAFDGERSQALAQYETCRRLLKQELGVEPSRETITLYEGIRDGKFAQAKATVLGNLPTSLTSFIGRQREMVEVKRLLATAHLLTLTGAGGCGKTRLALQVAGDLTNEYPDGVWFVDLAPLADPALVPQAITSVFDLHQVSNTPIVTLLQNYFRAKNLLLVLDNCEHLIQACAQLCDGLLRACPDLKILATSREALNIAGETALRVPSLAVPDLQKSSSTEMLEQSESVRLFIERARAARSDFQLSNANTRAIAQVCRRLDGIPLAIELAAARVNALSVEEIAVWLDDRFRLLTSGSRTALPRYQTLRASMDWSYDLLSDVERALLRRLGVFVGGFTLDAAEQVCSGEWKVDSELSTDHHPPSTVLDLLSQLVQKSLVVSEQSAGSRYRLLETIREYALAKLRDAGEADLYRARHLEFFLGFAEGIEPRLVETDQVAWLDRLEMEHDNLRAAARWAEEKDNGAAALRLASALHQFRFVRGYFTEARKQFDTILALPSAKESRWAHLRARALYYAATNARNQSDYAAASPLAHEGLAIFKTLGDKKGTADALSSLGLIVWEQGDYASARSFQTAILAIQRELGNRPGVAMALMLLGTATREAGDNAEGRRLIEEALAIFRQLGRKQHIARALMHLGSTAIAQRDPAARSILEEGLAIFRGLGDKWGTGRCLHDLGQAVAWQGDYELARACFEESLALLREIGDRRNVVKCVEGLAGIAVAHGQMEQAARLFGASEAVREKLGTPLPASYRANYERTTAVLTAQVGKEHLAKWWAEGRALSLEQAIEYALENLKAEK